MAYQGSFCPERTVAGGGAYIDLYFNPDVSRFGLMDWAAFDKIVEKGYEHAMIVLKSLSDEDRASFQG